MLTGSLFETSDEAVPLAFVGGLFTVFAGGFILIGLIGAVALALAGLFLSRRTRYTYCLVVAGLACMFMPFGTVLGVFTIIVLVRPSVKAMFEGDAAALETGA